MLPHRWPRHGPIQPLCILRRFCSDPRLGLRRGAEACTPAERAAREEADFLRHTDAAGRGVEFHGLRVHYISRVVEVGANVTDAMELARHSDPKLTLKTYSRVGIHSISRVLDGMPKADAGRTPQPERMRATGTDRDAGRCPNACPQQAAV